MGGLYGNEKSFANDSVSIVADGCQRVVGFRPGQSPLLAGVSRFQAGGNEDVMTCQNSKVMTVTLDVPHFNVLEGFRIDRE